MSGEEIPVENDLAPELPLEDRLIKLSLEVNMLTKNLIVLSNHVMKLYTHMETLMGRLKALEDAFGTLEKGAEEPRIDPSVGADGLYG